MVWETFFRESNIYFRFLVLGNTVTIISGVMTCSSFYDQEGFQMNTFIVMDSTDDYYTHCCTK